MEVAALIGERILARIERIQDRVSRAELLAKIHAGWIDLAGIGALVERHCVLRGRETVSLRRLGEAGAGALYQWGESVDVKRQALHESATRCRCDGFARHREADLNRVVARGRFGQGHAGGEGWGCWINGERGTKTLFRGALLLDGDQKQR